jgi:hypothetical protein
VSQEIPWFNVAVEDVMDDYHYRSRYVSTEEKPDAFFVCQHLPPRGREVAVNDLGLLMARDSSLLGKNFHVRYCQACKDAELETERGRSTGSL